MFIKNKNIDNGKELDWGKTSKDYAKYRDIYPQIFYDKIAPSEFDSLHYCAITELKIKK